MSTAIAAPHTAPRRAVRAVVVGAVAALALLPASTAVRAAPGVDAVERRIQADERSLELIVEEYDDLRDGLRDTRERIAALTARMHPLEQAVEAQRAEAGRVAAGAYRAGGVRTAAVLATVLTTGSTDRVVDPLLMLHRLGRERHRAIDRLTGAHERLAAARRDAEELATRLAGQQRQLAERRTRIEADLARLNRLRRETGRAAERPPTGGGTLPDAADSSAGARAVRFAHAQLGKPYRWGADGPDSYDCSGLTSAAWAVAGVRLPHNAARQFGVVARISRAERRPGDLIFYYRDIGHVAIYIGQGRMIHAPRPGERVRVDLAEYQPVRGYGRPRA